MVGAFQSSAFQNNAFQVDSAAVIVVPPPDVAGGGRVSRKKLKAYHESERRFQRLKRQHDEEIFGPKKFILPNVAEIGGPKVIEIDDDDDDYDIMMWAAH
jgi:hypothetical protein